MMTFAAQTLIATLQCPNLYKIFTEWREVPRHTDMIQESHRGDCI